MTNFYKKAKSSFVLLKVLFVLSAMLFAFLSKAQTWSEVKKLTASDAFADDRFNIVAISADGLTAVVGANHAWITSNDNGAAYVYEYNGGAWTEVAKLTASDGAENDQFGWSVSVSSDGSIVAIGARYANVGANDNQGAVYIFEKPSTGWATTSAFDAKLTASDGDADNYFGVDVQVSSDGATIIVGAEGWNSGQGAAYLFEKPGADWLTTSTFDTKLTASDGAGSDLFGYSVSISSNGSTVAVGAYADDISNPAGNSDEGSVYVFEKPVGGWVTATENAKLSNSAAAVGDHFGTYTSITDDGATIVTGAFATEGGNADQGAIYIYERPGGGWATTTTYDAKLTASDGIATDLLVYPAISGDGSTIVAGAIGVDVGGNSGQGAAYIYINPGTWTTTSIYDQKLTASDGEAGDSFGSHLEISSDGSYAIVGALHDDGTTGSAYTGSAYIFSTITGTAPILSGCNFSGDETTTVFTGTIADNGGSTITACGFIWGTTDVVANLISGVGTTSTDVPADAIVQTGDFSATINTDDLPATYYFIPYATNANGTTYGDAACSQITPEFSCSYSNLTSTSVTLEGALIDAHGLAFVSYGFFYTDDMMSPTPTVVAATSGDASGFSVDITGLTPGTTYYFAPYGEDAGGDPANGNTICQFTTPVDATGTAIINGCNFGGDETTTTFIGSILTNGGSTITECGFYYGIDNNAADLIANGTKLVSSTAVQEGDFSEDIATADLPMNYYFVPYAINGDGLSYGEMPCSSETIVPEFSCNSTNLTETSVTLEGVVVDAMGIEFVSFEFWYGADMESEPVTVAATSGDASGFSVDITGLTPGTTYFFMPFGVDGEGHQAGSLDFCQFTTPVEATGTAIINGCNFGGDETTTTFIGSILTNGGSTITECGFYYGTYDNAAGLIANGDKLVSSATVQEGEFSADIATADLPMNYYFVPYVINGDGLSYGEMPCSSETIVPEFSCNSSNLTATSVTLEGAVVDAMGIEFVNFGFWYGADMGSEPVTVAATSGDANGFSVDITGLTPGTTYFIMPYGEDSEGHQAGSLDFCQFTTPVATELIIPNAFTPNNDGFNDMFEILGISAYPNNKITIVNRWGNKVYEKNGYNNDWDGRSDFGVSVSKDEILPEGVYFYILDLGDGSDVIKGSIYLKKK